ncbi:NUDIX hydrolase [Paenibacillus sp. GSMTC-2017]|uniref:NUDIX hydrolase n=1 Tax=Paenibacillus sp. GSMTC-2017 TaxID=2794350 RepID=UPI0018D620E1|nr:NUDIX hydrolase [Paenibacillus sp. GSMTC-2017]MBH5320315.1 NUDIX hydrolase [Paenibacillus sp. GSMTC-2017]
MSTKWLDWAKELQAISQIGLTYSKDVYDLERYELLRNISIEIMHEYTKSDMSVIRDLFANESGYATPKVDIRAVVFQEDKILLVKETLDGAWALPGGWADIGLSPSEVAVKEVKEEAGYIVSPCRLLAVYDKKFHEHPESPYHVYKFFILCTIVGGAPEIGVETSEINFFEIDQLPDLSLERNTKKQIQTMYNLYKDPTQAVLLD